MLKTKLTGLFILLLLLDQLSKFIISKSFQLFEEKILIQDFLSLFYVHNTGVAFSLFNHFPQLVLVFNFLFICLLLVIYWRVILRSDDLGSLVLFTILLAGAFGNFLDRLVHNYVIDFIVVNLQFWTIPTFNFADIYIFCACILLIIHYSFYSK